MKSKELDQLQALQKGQRFLDHHADRLQAVNSSPARAEYDFLISAILERAEEQRRCTDLGQSQTRQIRSLRNTLSVEHVIPLITFIQNLPSKLPEFQTIKAPPASLSSHRYARQSQGIADGLKKARDVLISHHFRSESVDDFIAAADALAAMCAARVTTRLQLRTATVGIADDLRTAARLRKVISSLITNHCGGGSRVLGEWQATTIYARRLAKPPEPKRLGAGPAPAPPALPAPAQDTGRVDDDREPRRLIANPAHRK